jgi:hypothetical protein
MWASRLRVATMNKRYNNALATSMVQGIKAKIHSRPAFTTPPRSTSSRRSMKAATHDVLLKQGERTCTVRRHDDDDSNRFPAFTSNITGKSYPKEFKPIGIPKYDGKQDPRQWIRCYSVAIEVSGGSNSTKAL